MAGQTLADQLHDIIGHLAAVRLQADILLTVDDAAAIEQGLQRIVSETEVAQRMLRVLLDEQR